MPRIELALVPIMWFAWLAYWIVASFCSKETCRRSTSLSRSATMQRRGSSTGYSGGGWHRLAGDYAVPPVAGVVGPLASSG